MTLRSDLLASDAVAVTASDTVEVGYAGLYIGTTGDVTVKGASGVAVTFTAVPAGKILPIAVCYVMATDTTASDIVGFIP